MRYKSIENKYNHHSNCHSNMVIVKREREHCFVLYICVIIERSQGEQNQYNNQLLATLLSMTRNQWLNIYLAVLAESLAEL